MPNPRPIPKTPALPPAILDLSIDDHLPDEQDMLRLDVSVDDFADFLKCFKITLLTSQGMTQKKAVEIVGVSVRSLYTERWRGLLTKARRIVMGQLMQGVHNASTIVMQNWEAIISSTVNIAINGAEDRDKINATELLYTMYLANGESGTKDDSDQATYLKQEHHNFNPMSATTLFVNVNISTSGGQDKQPAIEAEIIRE